MNPFSPTPPEWTTNATHAVQFCCPQCQAHSSAAEQVWINRQAPVMTEEYQRIWQEFYGCQCGKAWWAWSSDRPPSRFSKQDIPS